MPSDQPLRAAFYVRLSKYRDGETSTARQEADCRRLCESKGWLVARPTPYLDSDISAWTGVARPAFEQALADAAKGQFDVLVIWKLDRFARSVVDAVRGAEKLKAAGVALASFSDPIDTTTPMGMMFFQLGAMFAELESATISYRVRNTFAAQAAAGRAKRGGLRCYGYNRDDTINEPEAEVLRQAAADFLVGKSMRQIAIAINAAGHTGTGGQGFQSAHLLKILRSPRLAGLVEHNGEIFPGTWEPILDMDTHLALNAVEGRRSTLRGPSKRHLLSGKIRCHECGGPMSASGRAGSDRHRYFCVKAPGKNGCGKTSIHLEKTEDFVRDAWVKWSILNTDVPDLTEPETTGLAERLALNVAELDAETKAFFAVKDPGKRAALRASYMVARDSLAEAIAADQAALLVPATPVVPVDGLTGGVGWELATDEQKRAILDRDIARLVVYPAARGAQAFNRGPLPDGTRIEIVWREAA